MTEILLRVQIDAVDARVEELEDLLRQVIDSPTNHRGTRTALVGTVQTAEPYVAKRINTSLIRQIQTALGDR